MTTTRLQRYADTIAINEEIMRYYREGVAPRFIAKRLQTSVHRVWRVTRAYASAPPSAS